MRGTRQRGQPAGAERVCTKYGWLVDYLRPPPGLWDVR